MPQLGQEHHPRVPQHLWLPPLYLWRDLEQGMKAFLTQLVIQSNFIPTLLYLNNIAFWPYIPTQLYPKWNCILTRGQIRARAETGAWRHLLLLLHLVQTSLIWWRHDHFVDAYRYDDAYGDVAGQWSVSPIADITLIIIIVVIQVDGWSVQWETWWKVQRGFLRADGGWSLKGVQVSLHHDHDQWSWSWKNLKRAQSIISYLPEQLMGSQWRFPACARPMLFLSPNNAVSSPTSWYKPSTKTLWRRTFLVLPGDPQQSRVDQMGGYPQHKRLPSQRRLCWQHDHTHPWHSQVKPWMWNKDQVSIELSSGTSTSSAYLPAMTNLSFWWDLQARARLSTSRSVQAQI